MTEPSAGAPAPAPLPPPERPAPAIARDPYRVNGKRTTLAAALVMIGVVLGTNAINEATPAPSDPTAVSVPAIAPQDPGPSQDPTVPPVATTSPVAAPNGGTVVDVGVGVLLHVPAGWTPVDTSSSTLAFQKSGVVVSGLGIAWSGTPTDLAIRYRDAWFASGQLTADDPQAGTVNGYDAAAINYTGLLGGTQVDGGILAATKGGRALIINYFGGKSAIAGLTDDVNAIVGSFEITGVTQ